MSDQTHPRRGDVMVIHRPLTIDYIGKGRDTIERYCVAIVEKGSRRHLAERVNLGHGVSLAISSWQVKAWCPAAMVDMPSLCAWLDSDESLMTFSTFEAARDIVRRFRAPS